MRRIVGTALVAVLIGAVLWAADARWGLWSRPTPTPVPTATPTPDAGAWREAPELIGTLYLAACRGWTETYTALRPVPVALLEAAAASWPASPAIRGFLALSRPLYIPRASENVAKDVDAWLAAHASNVDCAEDIWTDADVAAIRGEKRVAFFGMARPIVREGKAVWEMAFAAVRWK